MLLNEEAKKINEKVFNQQIETVNKISAIQHEYKRHLNNIVRCIVEQRYNDLDEYVSFALKEADKHLIPIPINFENYALNALYGRFVQQCAEHAIDLTSDVRFRKFDFLSEFDASVIFGNLFDNALESCAALGNDNRRIELVIMLKRTFVVIKLSNTYSHELVLSEESGLPLSTRRNYLSEGHGIKNIQSTLQKYNGYLSFTHTENEFSSIARIDIQNL